MSSPSRSLVQPSPSPSRHHDPFNRALYSSTPSSSSSRVDTPTASEPDMHVQIYIPSDIPDNLAYHIYKIQAELASTPAAPSLFFDSKGTSIMDAFDAFGAPTLPATSWPPSTGQQESGLTLIESQSKRSPSWLRSFTEGLRTTDSKRSAGLALDVIRGSLWNYDGYNQLVQWLCWKAAAPLSLENAGVTLFTANLADKFGKFAGQEAALSFLDHLEQAFIELCQSSWSSKSPASNYTPAYTASAMRLLRYMGDLHARALVHPNTVHHCLGILIDEMVSIEHIEAIHTLIESSTKTLWAEDPTVMMFDFIHAFTSHTRNVSNISRRGSDCLPQEIYKRVSGVVELVNSWKDELEREVYGVSY